MPNPRFLIHDLNPAQRAAVEATRGPVCILAGAGTGKTRVISRRVAYAIATDAVHPKHVLVVTFTEKAAGEMRERLAQLGFPGVQAHTFHAAAWRQLRYFWPRLSSTRPPEVLESKAPLLVPLQRSLPGGYKFTGVKDLADEIEWAKARRITPDGYQAAVERTGRQTPLPPDLFAGLFRRYERAKERAGRIDFEDMLAHMLDGLESATDVAEEFRGQYRWFSVDEYQDTNPLQQALLEAWLGERRDLAVVGDEDQTIYTFTGASSEYLTGFTRRFPDARVFQLEENYRSTAQVLGELFFRRSEVRQGLRLLRSRSGRANGGGLVDAIEAVWFERMDFRRDQEPDGEEARQRHASLVSLLGIAERLEAADEQADMAAFLADVERRAADEAAGVGGGVNLVTYHRAKGLEFDAVLLPALEEGLLPIRQASAPAEVEEERRLLYVGLTRARVHLWLAWTARRVGPSGREQPRKPSRFLDDLAPPGQRVRPRAVA